MSNFAKNRTGIPALTALLAMAVVAGCGGGDTASTTTTTPSTATASTPKSTFVPKADAGIPVTIAEDPEKLKGLVANRSFGARPDPFALLPEEQQFERLQRSERVVSELGWSLQYEPPEERFDDEFVEPQPYRRLAGVLVGDTVQAIMILEDGSALIVTPGMRVPNTEWTVVSIDTEKAILRRPGRTRPTEIVVKLESPPAGMNVGGGQAPGRPPFGGPAGRAGGGFGPGGRGGGDDEK